MITLNQHRRSGLPPRRNGTATPAGFTDATRRLPPWNSAISKETETAVPSIRRGGSRDLRFVSLFFLLFSTAAAAEEGLFGYRELPAPTLAAFPQWSDLLARIEREREAYPRCDIHCDTLRGRLWRTYLQRAGEPVERSLLWEINAFVNTFPRRPSDQRWSAPLEFLQRGGDAVENAVMKYVTLRELGVEESRLHLVLGRDVLTDRPHALLAVEHDGERRILDSRSDTILAHRAVAYFQPLFSLNAEGRVLHLPPPFEEKIKERSDLRRPPVGAAPGRDGAVRSTAAGVVESRHFEPSRPGAAPTEDRTVDEHES